MNEIKIFENPAFGKIRTAGTSEEPLFCLADICKAVELTNPSSVKSRLDARDVQLIDLHALSGGNADMVGNTMATFINECAFYDVLLFSSSEKVKPFPRWVTHDVLPSIRKTGSEESHRLKERKESLVYKDENGQALTTSVLVAEKFGKEHSDVLKAIRNILYPKGENSLFVENQQLTSMFALTYTEKAMPTGGGTKKVPLYVMNRDGFTLLAMGFTGDKALAFKLEYIRAFNAMEQQIRYGAGVPQTFAEALMLAARQQERIESQQKQIEELEPKGKYFDDLVDRKLNINFRDTAKEIGLKQNDFIKRLIGAKYVYRDARGQLKPYAAYVGSLFIIKECKSGEKWAGNQTLVTPQGRETFSLLYGKKE